MERFAGLVRSIADTLTRHLPGPASIAGAAAASGDPAPLLDLRDLPVAEQDGSEATAA